jgi:predicted DNA-binding protein YlxM (UPF0122 family)
MKLRKGENSGREHTFTGLASIREADIVEWEDLNSLLDYLLASRIQADEDGGGNPEGRLARKEFLSTIRHMLRCLATKERAIFEAHFFRQLSPAEIARLFSTTTDNVYQSLYRARNKVREERTRIRLQDYIRERREADMSGKVLLVLKKGPGSAEWRRCKTSFAGAVYAVLPYTSRAHYTLTEVMGLTSQAFRLTVEEEYIGPTGPSMYFWESKFRDGLLHLGLESEHSGDGGAPPTPYMLNKSIAHIRRSLMLGIPVIGWDFAEPEFGIIYGYDDEEQLLYAEDARGKRQIPYDRLGRGLSGGLFVLSVTGEQPVEQWEAVAQALDMAIQHAYGELTFVGYVCGLTAYDCWMDAFRKKRVDPLGNAYTLGIAAEARAYAAEFLHGVKVKLEAAGEGVSADIAAQAGRQYEEVAAVLKELAEMFPFPSGGSPNHPTTACTAVEMLGRARSAEAQGVLLLERLCRGIRMIG